MDKSTKKKKLAKLKYNQFRGNQQEGKLCTVSSEVTGGRVALEWKGSHSISFRSALDRPDFSTTGQGFTDARKKKAIQQYKKLVRKEQRRKGDLRAHSAGSNRGEHPGGGKDAQHTSQQVEKRKHSHHKDTLVPLLFPCFVLFCKNFVKKCFSSLALRVANLLGSAYNE